MTLLTHLLAAWLGWKACGLSHRFWRWLNYEDEPETSEPVVIILRDSEPARHGGDVHNN